MAYNSEDKFYFKYKKLDILLCEICNNIQDGYIMSDELSQWWKKRKEKMEKDKMEERKVEF